MPVNRENSASMPLMLGLVMAFIACAGSSLAYEGIQTYYIRYDIKTSNNKIVEDSLLMVPAENDFRAENFSQISVEGAISAARQDSGTEISKRIREDAMKTILMNHGLKSISSKDNDTVLSCEGAVITPLTIIKKVYNEHNQTYTYRVRIEFAPIAFPDRWNRLGIKYKIKKLMRDFIQFFK